VGKNCRIIVEGFCVSLVCSLRRVHVHLFFHNSSTILLCLEEFFESRLGGRIVEGIVVEELWKHLVNAVPGQENVIFVGRNDSNPMLRNNLTQELQNANAICCIRKALFTSFDVSSKTSPCV
jgi:hypothetical protein